MTRETYLRNRKVFEMRYINCLSKVEGDLGLVDIRKMKKRFRYFELFLNIYARDRMLEGSAGVSSILRFKPVWVDGRPFRKVRLNLRSRSMVDRDPEFYEKAHALCAKQLQIR